MFLRLLCARLVPSYTRTDRQTSTETETQDPLPKSDPSSRSEWIIGLSNCVPKMMYPMVHRTSSVKGIELIDSGSEKAAAGEIYRRV